MNEANMALLYGDDYLVREQLHKMIEASGCDQLNLDRRSGSVDQDELIALCEQLPCFCAHRMIVLTDLDLFQKGDAGKLVDYLQRLPATTRLIFCQTTPPDKRRALYKYLAKHALVMELQPLKAQALVKWVQDEARARGLTMARPQAELLVEVSGEDMGTLQNELNKFSMLEKSEISREDILDIASRSPEYNAFLLHGLLLSGKIEQAFALVREIGEAERTFVPLVALLSGKFTNMYMAKKCLIAGKNAAQAARQVAELAGVREFAARYAVQECGTMPLEQIETGMRVLAEYDLVLKSGAPDEGMECVLIRAYGL